MAANASDTGTGGPARATVRAVQARGTALVTGASRGIGRGLAVELARRGFDVLAAVRDPTAAEGIADEVEPAAAGSIEVVRLDVCDLGAFAPPAGLRVLVNNAGVDTANTAVEHTPEAEWRRVFDTNVFAVAELTRRSIPALRASGGGVVCNLTSAGLIVPMPFFAPYRASKAALGALGESLRAELAPFGIRVLEVLPGPIATDMLAESSTVPEAVATPDYAPLAERVALARGDVDASATPVAAAAAAIADAILDDDAPLRVACDPMGDALLAAWRSSSDEELAAGFLAAFAVE